MVGQIWIDVGDFSDVVIGENPSSSAPVPINTRYYNRNPSFVCCEVGPLERSVSKTDSKAVLQEKRPSDGNLLPLAEAIGRHEGKRRIASIVVKGCLHQPSANIVNVLPLACNYCEHSLEVFFLLGILLARSLERRVSENIRLTALILKIDQIGRASCRERVLMPV